MNPLMPSRGKAQKVSVTVRIDAAVAREAREFVRDQMGAPLYMRLNTLVQDALVERIAALRKQLASNDHLISSNNRRTGRTQ